MIDKGGEKGGSHAGREKDHWNETVMKSRMQLPFFYVKSRKNEKSKDRMLLTFENLRTISLYFWTMELYRRTMQKHYVQYQSMLMNLIWAFNTVWQYS